MLFIICLFPEFFRNEIVCEGEHLNLNCPAGQSITIYAASFGTTKSGVLECRQPEGLQTDGELSPFCFFFQTFMRESNRNKTSKNK